MSNDNTPQTQVTIGKADLDSLVANLIEARACIEVATSAASRNKVAEAAINESVFKNLIAFVWSKAIQYANDVVEDRMGEEIDIRVEIDEDIYDDLNISIRGSVDKEICVGDYFSVHIHESFDGVAEQHDEILQEFLKREAAVSVTAEPVEININLSKDNA